MTKDGKAQIGTVYRLVLDPVENSGEISKIQDLLKRRGSGRIWNEEEQGGHPQFWYMDQLAVHHLMEEGWYVQHVTGFLTFDYGRTMRHVKVIRYPIYDDPLEEVDDDWE